jgi:hypothetical protein
MAAVDYFRFDRIRARASGQPFGQLAEALVGVSGDAF